MGIYLLHIFIEQEVAFHIVEAQNIVSCWNSGWLPPYFMIDHGDAKLNAIVTEFLKSEVYLCEFDCEQSWIRYYTYNVMHV